MKEYKNIINKHTLKDYNKKFPHHSCNLVKIKKEEVKLFDKNNGFTDENCLLKKKKWWLINDTYYEIPKLFSIRWFSSISIAAQIGLCLLGVTTVSAAIATPIIIISNRIELVIDQKSINDFEEVKFTSQGNKYVATLKTKDSTKLPTVVDIKNNNKSLILDTDYTYSMETNELSIFKKDLKRKVNITLAAVDKKWFNDKDYINSLKTTDIGLIKEVNVNGLNHKVRLIGIDHDINENNNKIHTTWEFANLISDEQGCSLGYQWHDNNDPENSNSDFINSSIRKALTGHGEFSSTVYCSSKSSKDKWDEKYTNKVILNMLEPGLKCAIKKIKKEVRTGPTKDVISNYDDRLFMLSTKEIGYLDEIKSTGSTYPYYENFTWGKGVKKQVNNIVYSEYPNITTKETIWKGRINNFAGYNESIEDSEGGYYWLCAPRSDYSYSSFYCDHSGNIFNGGYTYNRTYGVAPAFCL